MNKEIFQTPKAEIVMFANEDIITSSMGWEDNELPGMDFSGNGSQNILD